MRTRLAINCFLFIGLACSGQSLIQEGKLWSNTFVGSEAGSNYSSYYIQFTGDTLIDETHYKYVMKADDAEHAEWFVEGYIREDTELQRVFLMTDAHEEETLLYDFSLEKSDSISTAYGYFSVDSVAFRPFGNLPDDIKHIYFETGAHWIKGIGSPSGVLEGVKTIPIRVGGYWDLLCYWMNNELIYHNPRFESCFHEGTLSNLNSSRNDCAISCYSNGDNVVRVKVNNASHGTFTLFSTTGQMIYSTKIEAPTATFIAPDKGLFLYRFESYSGTLSLGKVIVQ
jgi:hypothetical protein